MYIYAYIHIYIYMYICIYVYTCIHVYIYTFVQDQLEVQKTSSKVQLGLVRFRFCLVRFSSVQVQLEVQKTSSKVQLVRSRLGLVSQLGLGQVWKTSSKVQLLRSRLGLVSQLGLGQVWLVRFSSLQVSLNLNPYTLSKPKGLEDIV